MRLREITISGFRGFKNKQTLNLDNDMIFVRGANGSGKSSLVEAIEWFFFDDISRKKKSACKSEYAGDFLRNLHCSGNEEAFVEILAECKGKDIRLRKKLVSPQKKEYCINGSPAKDFSPLGISFAEVQKPILSQVEVKHYVETDPKDRWEETNKILGLGVLSEFRSDLQELLNSKKAQNQYQSSKKVCYWIESEVEAFPELGRLDSEMAKRPFSASTFKGELIATIRKTYSTEAGSAKKMDEVLDEEFARLAQKSKNFETIQSLTTPVDRSLMIDLSTLTDEVKQLSFSVRQSRPFKADLHRFLEMGRDLMKEPTCPFCLEETVTAEKKSQIDTRIEESEEAAVLLSDIKSKLAKTSKMADEFYLRISFSLNASGLEKVREKIRHKEEYSKEVTKIDSVRKRITSLDQAVSAFKANMSILIGEASNIIEGKTDFDDEKVDSETATLEGAANLVEENLSRLRAESESLLSALLARAPSLSAEEKKALSKAMLLRNMANHLKNIIYVGVYENNLDEAASLIDELEKFEKLKSEQLLAGLNKKIVSFYSRLNPDEKTQFSRISPKKGKSRRMQIRAVSYGKAMNPVTCFSESHMNCLCLSIYFSQRVLDNPYWDFVILDDPVQSMDEDHAKNLIRILDEVHRKKQVIVMSHNNKFCQDFTDLFYGQDYLLYEFSGYSEEGPKIDLKRAPFETYISIARQHSNGNAEERAISGNNLRKAIERLTLDLLVHKGKVGRGKARGLTLDERFDKIESTKSTTLREIGEIKGVLNICDSASHEPPRTEVSSRELVDGIKIIEALQSKYLKR